MQVSHRSLASYPIPGATPLLYCCGYLSGSQTKKSVVNAGVEVFFYPPQIHIKFTGEFCPPGYSIPVKFIPPWEILVEGIQFFSQ